MFIVFVLSVAKVLVNSLSWLMCSYCFYFTGGKNVGLHAHYFLKIF
uniref:Uncharacterized protein n=1 Tax=Anguilla anguilla TaxID=7936 RepID=A0A0E9UEM3_ANGAN